MKKILGAVGIIIVLFGIWTLAGARFEHYAKERLENTYSQKFEYKDTKRVAELKDEVETLRVKALRLQAALDSCVYGIKEEVAVAPKPVYKAKKSTKALDDCNKGLMETKAKLGEYIEAKAQMEVEKDLHINFLKRQMDTCAYFVQEMDKALLKMSNDVTKLTNEKDSLYNVLQTPISVTKEFPCLKAKKGTVVMTTVIPETGEKDFTISNFNLPKDKYKAAKKSCKKAQAH